MSLCLISIMYKLVERVSEREIRNVNDTDLTKQVNFEVEHESLV